MASMDNPYYKRTSEREIPFERLQHIKDELGVSWREMGEMMGVSRQMVDNYRRRGKVVCTRYYALQQALYLDIEDEVRERRAAVTALFKPLE